jgi:predicted nuclease with TOPRIM domain
MGQTPVFVKIEQYEELTKVLDTIDAKINESTELLARLEKLKAEEDAQLQSWAASLEDVKARSKELNQALFTK